MQLINAQSVKLPKSGNIGNIKDLPHIQLRKSDNITEILLEPVAPLSELADTSAVQSIPFIFSFTTKGKKNDPTLMRYANCDQGEFKSLIVTDTYDELKKRATFNLRISGSILKSKTKLDYREPVEDALFEDNQTKYTPISYYLRQLFKYDTSIVWLAFYAQREPKEYSILSQEDYLKTPSAPTYATKLIDNTQSKELFIYLDIDNCTDIDRLISVVKEKVEAIKNNEGNYYIYLSNPSNKPYICDSKKGDDYKDLLANIRRIDPGRAQLENDVEAISKEIDLLYATLKLKISGVQFLFVLPTAKNKEQFSSKFSVINSKLKSTEFIKPDFVDCNLQPIQ